MESKNISAAIIAGGAGRRMGGIVKSKIVVDRQTIISRMMQVIVHLFDEILIVTNLPQEFSDFSRHRIVSDIFPGRGPLGGIHSALVNTSKEAVFVLAGDMPCISREIIEKQTACFLSSRHDVLVASIGSVIQPLHSVYRISVRDRLEQILSEGQDIAVRNFLKEARVGYMEIPDTDENRLVFTNINTPADLKSASGKKSLF